jgi:hypothetical protein
MQQQQQQQRRQQQQQQRRQQVQATAVVLLECRISAVALSNASNDGYRCASPERKKVFGPLQQ